MFNKKAKQVFKPRPPYPMHVEKKEVVMVKEEIKTDEVKQFKKKKKDNVEEETVVLENNEQ